ncbi:MAG: hypothetical protein U0M20_05960 [Christensenellales bacterium]|nr:hypothetical protein [Christensenellales bacterium]
MATEMKRLTFTITKEMGPALDRAKKDIFYDYNQSEMIRILITAGLDTLKNEARIERPLPNPPGQRQP